MRIVCTKSNLVKGVSIVSKAVPSKTTMPILECILVDASTDVIKLTANDMELGIETRIEGDILERGIIALNAKIFSEIVRKLPDSDVVIETTSDNQTLITCEKAKFNIAAQSGEDFSYLPVIEKEDYITVSEFTLKEVIRQTIFSIADNDTNKMMTGELFEIEGDILKVVSLDGHRISIRKIITLRRRSLSLEKRFRKSARSLVERRKHWLIFLSQRIISYLNLTKQLLYPV